MPSRGKIATAAQRPARLRGGRAAAAASSLGVVLLPARLFEQGLASGRLAQPFSLCDAGRYWLTQLKSRPETPAMTAVKEWLQGDD
jgi:LysR family transcriptional regulator of beta-lactamase